MMPENQTISPAPSARYTRVVGVLLWVRYALPLFAALFTLALGAFYNVSAIQGGKALRLSVLRLCFNTLKSARTYLLGSAQVQGVRNFYLFVVVLTVLLILFFLLSVAAAVFLLHTLYRVKVAKAAGDREGEKQAKIFLRAFLPNRAAVWVSMLPILLFALFPEIFSLLTRSRAMAANTVFYVRLNVVSLVAGVLLLTTATLDVYLRRFERALGADLFAIVPDATEAAQAAEADGEDEEDGDEDDV